MATAVADPEVQRGFTLHLPERLPGLKGKWLTIYTLLWAAALLVAVVAPVGSTVINYRGLGHPVWRPHGLVTNTTDRGITVSAVFGDEAKRAGVRVGDRIIAVDGWLVSQGPRSDHLRDLLDGPEGSTDTLRLRSPLGAERDVTLATRSSTAAQMFRDTGVSRELFDAATYFFDLAILLFLVPAAVLLFVRRRREIIPALLSMSFLGINGFVTGQGALVDAGISEKIVDAFADLLGWIPLVLALIAFPDGRVVPKWTAAAPLFILLILFNDVTWRVGWFDYLAVGLAIIVAGTGLVLRYRRFPAGLARQQLRWAFFGFLSGIALLGIAVPLLGMADQLTALDSRWVVWIPVFANILTGLAFPCMALGLIVSVLRYRLYDADTVIGRSAAYGLLTLAFVALFAGAEKFAEIAGERYFEHSIGIAAGAIGAAVAAALVVPLHNRVHRWAERRFQKSLIRLREGLPECVADLRESAPVEQLVSAVMSRVEAGVRSTREAVLLTGGRRLVIAGTRSVDRRSVKQWRSGWNPPPGEQSLDCDRQDPLFPLRVRLCIESTGEPETIGWLLLGPRPDGSFFGRDEREALAHVAGPVARAIHIAQIHERRDERAEQRIGALEAVIEKLAAALNGGPTAAPA